MDREYKNMNIHLKGKSKYLLNDEVIENMWEISGDTQLIPKGDKKVSKENIDGYVESYEHYFYYG